MSTATTAAISSGEPSQPSSTGPNTGPSSSGGKRARPPGQSRGRNRNDRRTGAPRQDGTPNGSSTRNDLRTGADAADSWRRGTNGPPYNVEDRPNESGNRQRRRNPRKPADPASLTGDAETGGSTSTSTSTPTNLPPRNGRRAQFDASARLTDSPGQASYPNKPPPPSKAYTVNSPAKRDDLTSILIRALRTAPYPDCPICFSAIHPAQPSWSCSPPRIAPKTDADGPNESTQCCWTTFHLKCIRSWAGKSVKEIADAYRARGEDKGGEWRCPGCQLKRTSVPDGYLCFCGAMRDPKPPRLATPHSCGNSCTRPRTCSHSCPLACHPGPCPPCQITTQASCFCGRKNLSFRCGASQSRELSCGQVCDRPLGCGKHRCRDNCHAGVCEPCAVLESVRCYCGKEEKEVACGEGQEKECAVGNDAWLGRFVCENTCSRPFDCTIHKCAKPCHPPSSSPAPCPRSPSIITSCPCTKLPASSFRFPRTSCTDPIPTCGRTCLKPLADCEHVCGVPCHEGPCPPCQMNIVLPCRCGSTTRAIMCSEVRKSTPGAEVEILCNKPCGAQRACGRHQCNRLCCPLASLAGNSKAKGKRRTQLDAAVMDPMGWHECDLVCGKMLGCGNHQCEERDHRGVCPPCLRSSFEEMICNCGQTVLLPPIQCGTRISCTYPCDRPPPPCGHPRTQHACHEDQTPCPPCPFLASKPCACGKSTIDNVRCAQEKVSCGTACGKLLGCGFHRCEKLCHGDACGSCNSVCGKSRKLCLPAHHGCTLPCHAPSACPESEPCPAKITLSCPCGRLQQPATCGRSTSNPSGRESSNQLKCANSCLIAQRNARLADALGISQETRDGSREKPVVYNDELVAFARGNVRFCALVEKTFADFVSSDKRMQILPSMPEARRKFVHDLAAVYRMDTQMVDQEPNRSVQLIRRIDTRIPAPILSTSVPATSTPSLGKLADMRAPPIVRTTPGPTHVAAPAATRGWRSVVASTAAGPSPTPTPSYSTRQSNLSSASAGPVRPPVGALPSAIIPAVVTSREEVPEDWEADA